MSINVKGKTILLTGAFGLFGKQISHAYLKSGANVVLAGHNPKKIKECQLGLSEEYDESTFLVLALEITDLSSIQYCIAASVKKFKTIDVLVNNAAIDAKFDKNNIDDVNQSRFENFPIEVLKSSIDVNMIGTIQMTQEICKQMLKQGFGNIINVGSVYSMIAPNQNLYNFGSDKKMFKPVDYVASKSYIPNFTRYIATFYGKNNIRCNAIAPHGVYDGHDEQFVKNFSELSPIGRMCNREELDGPFIFLASDSSSYLTGTTIVLDGGWTAW
ncbi:MAG: SDR family oxidoreductase [Desulfobacula sp.]|jgi:NAD(P)-dependent dehydrogenase (short-subunit alcohol dehydrogenase family)|nr:SDR family oxidoreductase [Desulfobacula sp.]